MMAISAREARQQILDDLAAAIGQMALAVACLGEAFELLDVGSAERLEAGQQRGGQDARLQVGADADHGPAELARPELLHDVPAALLERAGIESVAGCGVRHQIEIGEGHRGADRNLDPKFPPTGTARCRGRGWPP